jgi:hypothetical protein
MAIAVISVLIFVYGNWVKGIDFVKFFQADWPSRGSREKLQGEPSNEKRMLFSYIALCNGGGNCDDDCVCAKRSFKNRAGPGYPHDSSEG